MPAVNLQPSAFTTQLFSSVLNASNVSTAETDLISYQLPAGALAAEGKAIRITVFWTTAANANNKTIKLYFGATQLLTSLTVAANAAGWSAVAVVMRTGAATQAAVGDVSFNDGNVRHGAVTAPTETLSGAVMIKVTGTSGTASSDITTKGMLVEAIN